MTKDYKNRKYSVVSYDPKWKDEFEKEAEILKSIFGLYATSIEHIGSTAVPGLFGKPTIDILILVDDVNIADTFNKQMESIGYKSFGEYVSSGTKLFVKEINNTRLVNVHIYPKEHAHVKEMLVLRNYFQNHPEIVREYSNLKIDLFAKYPNDYGLYRKYKDNWMEKLKEKIKIK